MRHLLLFLLFLGFYGSATFAQEDVVPTVSEGLVTVRVNGLDNVGMTAISARISKEQQINIEYSCVRSGIVVVRLQAMQVTEKADVVTVVKRLFQQAGITGAIDFLDIHVERSAVNKC